MEMPKPTIHHGKLEKLAGTWIGEEMMSPSPWDPKGGPARGVVDARMDIDGLYLIADYKQERDGKVSYRGHGVYGFDPKKSEYLMYWFDSMSTEQSTPARGMWEGNRLSFEMKSRTGGFSRYVYELQGEGRYTFQILMSKDGQTWTPWLESSWSRR